MLTLPRTPKLPTVGVVVPTLNSERTLQCCLDSVRNQSLSADDVVIVDAFSSDATVDVARRFGRVIRRDCGIAGARLVGAKAVASDLVLNLDSDQVLAFNAIEEAVRTGRPAVALGETSSGKGLVAAANKWDRDQVEHDWQSNMDPLSGPIRPRLYERKLLISALERIPDSLRDLKPAPYSEDSLIFLNSGLKPEAVGYVPRAITHLENHSILKYASKWFNYGRSARVYRGTEFEALVWRRGRRVLSPSGRIRTYPALVLKGVPFFLGYHL